MILPLVSPLCQAIGMSILHGRGKWGGGGGPGHAGMKLGMNVAWINSWAGSWVFSNLMYHAAHPEKTAGTSNWTCDQGVIQVANKSDTFRFLLADHGDRLPAGEYTVLNPDGLKVHVGGWNAPGSGGYSTATQFTINHPAISPSAFCLHLEGDLTANHGNLAVILPGHLESWSAGNVWNEQFLDFYRGIKQQVLRFMDWTWASQNIETEWSDRALPTGVTFRTPWADGACVPYELICDLAGRLKVDVWVCSPVRATADYIQQMASLFNSHLPDGRNIWLEHGNEVWNYGVPWGDGTSWVSRKDYTKRTAVADFAGQRFVLNNHGLVSGTRIVCHTTVENRRAKSVVSWQFSLGVGVYVKTLDANSFEVHESAALVNKVPVTAGTSNVLFSVDGEAGKSENINANFGSTCLRNWDIFDNIMGASRVVRLLAAQAANPTTTAVRLAVAGVSARASAVAIAPYYSGTWFGGAVLCANGQLTPRFWASDSYPVHMAVYPASSSPTAKEVVAGTGAINKQVLGYSAGSGDYTSGVAVQGLVNGTPYAVHFVYADNEGYWHLSVGASPTVAPTTVYAYDSYANQAMRNRLSIIKSVTEVATHKALAGSIPVLCYEGGLHFHHGSPEQMKAWISGYQESPTFGDVTRRYLTELASSGSAALCYYGDSLATTFSIANGFHDTSDVRYLEFKRRAGYAANLTQPAFNFGVIPSVVSEPEYPYSWHDLGEPGFSYEILSGNSDGNFTVVGSQLTLVAGTNINWGSPTLVTLKIRASTENFTRTFSVSFSTGNAWYEADATFAWDSKTDTDSAQINPVVGGVIPLVEGQGAAIVDGLWHMAASNRYYSATAVPVTVVSTKPILWAAVLDRAGQTGYYKNIWRHGDGNFMSAYLSEGNRFEALSNTGGSGTPLLVFSPSIPTGPHVFWVYYDPIGGRIHAGVDQVENGSVAKDFGSSTVFKQRLGIGGASYGGMNSAMKHGSMQIMNRENLTITDALAIVAKMQAHHGIA